MDKNTPIALTDLVRELGYENPIRLANWIGGIIKNKENFSDLYEVKSIPKGRANGRSEKNLVNSESRIFVDNLCVLKPYMSFFSKSSNGDNNFSPYRALKEGSYKKTLADKSQKLHKRLIFEKTISGRALDQLSNFMHLLEKNSSIDITSESLRDLMKASIESGEIIDLSDSFQIAAWNDLAELKEKLKEDGENSLIYRSIGEKMIELGDNSGAIEALNEATNLDQSDGIAWAIKAKIYLDLLKNSNIEQMEALAQTEFSGFIEHPINSEEHWINQRIEDTISTTEKMHSQFIEASLFALKNWPHWQGVPRTDKEGNKHRNFMPNTKIKSECSSDIGRDWLFFHFVIALKKSDMNEQREKLFIKILRSFQSYDPEMYPIPYLTFSPYSSEYQSTTPFNLKLIEILNWFSPEDTEIALKEMISRFKSSISSASESIAILGRSNIKELFWDYLGKDEYTKLYSLCEKYELQNRQRQRLYVLCKMQLTSILSVFNSEMIGMMKHIEEPNMFKIFYPDKNIDSSKIEISKHLKKVITQAPNNTAGWSDYLDDDFWKKTMNNTETISHNYEDTRIQEVLFPLLFISPLLEMASGNISELNINTFSSFVDNRAKLKIVVRKLPYQLIVRLIKSVDTSLLSKTICNKFDEINELASELHWENEFEDGQF